MGYMVTWGSAIPRRESFNHLTFLTFLTLQLFNSSTLQLFPSIAPLGVKQSPTGLPAIPFGEKPALA
jgi:hypothetical protein